MIIRLVLALVLAASTVVVSNAAEGAGEFGAFAASEKWTLPKDPAVLKSLSEWQDRKIGLLIHWGTYSQWGIVESWSLVTTRHKWNNRPPQHAQLDDRAYMKVYEDLVTTFNPVNFNPEKWAVTAKNAGMKYVIFTTKHHDGFCMWNTATTDYRITSPRCPFHADPRADVVKQLCEAYRKQGLSTGLYFSKADWHCPYFWLPEIGPGKGQGPNYNPLERPDVWKKFKDFTWKQIEELMTSYGPQEVLWLDAGSVRPPNASIDMDGMAAMTRKHQPGLIVVDRTVHGPNENYVTPEGHIPEHYLPYPWESCITMGTQWTYKPNDEYKSAGTLIRNLCRIVARGGNYIIGIGPDGKGEYDPMVYSRLEEIGSWLRINGEAIYATRPAKPYEKDGCVFTAGRDGSVYAIVLAKDDNSGLSEVVTVPENIIANAGKVEMLGAGELKIDLNGTISIPAGIRAKPPCSHAWSIKLTPKK